METLKKVERLLYAFCLLVSVLCQLVVVKIRMMYTHRKQRRAIKKSIKETMRHMRGGR